MTIPATRMPAVFIGHGSPTNALDRNEFTAGWRAIGRSLPRPRVILAISAHWYTHGTQVTSNAAPRTIHDFGGFAKELYEVRYPAPGDPSFATELAKRLKPLAVGETDAWGLDHGTWSVLVHAFPAADVPVVQLSIDATEPPAFHYRLGQQLAALRDEGALIVGSGGIVHNLARAVWDGPAIVPDWAQRFDERVRIAVETGDHAALLLAAAGDEAARLSVPTAEHYLPLLYVLGTQQPGEVATLPVTGFELGTISMTSVVLGAR